MGKNMTVSKSIADRAVVLERPNADTAIIRLVRESRRNTLSAQLIDELELVLNDIEAAPPRAVIVTGQGQAFCAGAEISEFKEMMGKPSVISTEYLPRILQVFERLRNLPCPTIAAINGHAMGGGLELAINCDFRIAAKGVLLALPEVQLGVVAAAAGVQQLHRLVGRAKALEILLLGDRVPADEALALGLVTSVCAPEDLEAKALEFADRFKRCAPSAVAETKRAVYRSEGNDINAADDFAATAIFNATSAPNFEEGIGAFLEKREASFSALPAGTSSTGKGGA